MTLDDRITLSIIVSPGHSGRTWLSMLIGAHPEALSLGEISEAYGRHDLGEVCMLCGPECEFWNGFNRSYDPEGNIFCQLGDYSGKRVLSISKLHKFRDQINHPRLLPKLIRLTRDGRAWSASVLRKYPQENLENMVRTWVDRCGRFDSWVEQSPPQDTLWVRYEDLLADTESTLRQICGFLGLEYQKEMQQYWRTRHHIVDGNAGTLSYVKRHFGLPVSLQFQFRNFYARQDPRDFRDERWRRELGPRELYVFERLAGGLNRAYGYPESQISWRAVRALRYRLQAISVRAKQLLRAQFRPADGAGSPGEDPLRRVGENYMRAGRFPLLAGTVRGLLRRPLVPGGWLLLLGLVVPRRISFPLLRRLGRRMRIPGFSGH